DYPFYCLWRLLEPDVLSTYQAFQNYPQAARERYFLRRTKEEMVYYDGRRIYPERECRTPGYDLTRPERDLYDDTTDYIRSFYNRARILNRSAARLAMSVFQRRLTSSTYALLKSFERRLEKLDELIARLESGELTQDELARMQLRLDALQDPFEERTADEDEAEDGLEGTEAAEQKLLAGVVATSLRELREERRRVEGLRNRARQIYEGPEEDSKFEKLRELIQAPDFRDEKILIFTEHRDTADFLTRKFEALGFAGQIARIDGTMSTLPGPSGLSERDEQVEFFRKPPDQGGARLMIATDAAGEGINLQFCWLMVNYDIPWNPARLEQRMGRLHRYKQKHDPVVMLNLFAKDTREGNVLQTLLDKLEKIRRQLRSDKVFDVVGLQFEGKSLRDIILRAVVDDDEEGALAELEGTLTPEQVQARIDVREKLLKTGGDVKAQLPRLRTSLDREELRRLLPGYVRRFVERSAPHLGARIEGDLDGFFALRGLPEPVLSVLESYPPEHRVRLTVNRPSEEEKAIFLHPGQPLYESYRRYYSARFARQALRGAVFVDPYAEAPYLFHLGSISIERRPDPELPEVYGRLEVRAVRLIGLRQTADGRAEESPVEHLMLLRGVPGPLEEAARWSLRAPSLRDLARKHLDEAILAPLAREHREGILATVPERERFLLRGFEYQEADLAAMRAALTERARKGDKSAEIELADVKVQQKNLPARRERALAILRREVELIYPGEVRILATALVVPSADPAERARHDREIELVAMQVARAHE
ncbi:MAG: helicase-related protein, partial [Candidatus Binatia bacterium]